MISIAEDNEFTVLIADLIEIIAGTDKFTLEFWVNGNELPFKTNESCDFYFMQEGVRVGAGKQIVWLFYDTINAMRLDYES